MYPYFYPSYIQYLFPFPNLQEEGMRATAPHRSYERSEVKIPPSEPPAQQRQGPSVMDVQYTQGYLKQHIGQKVKIEFLIGTNMLTDRIGKLTEVGNSYVVIEPEGTDDRMLCDLYSIKFVTFYK